MQSVIILDNQHGTKHGSYSFIPTEQVGESNDATKGSQGTIYRGQNIATGETVAIKKLFAQNSNTVYAKRERRLRTNHPNLVRILDDAERITDTGTVEEFVIQEFLGGPNLKTFIASHRYTDLPPSEHFKRHADTFAHIMYSVLDGLAELRRLELVHRDIKPDNIMFHRGVVKIIDFGVIKNLSDTNDATIVEHTVIQPKSLPFASPEQCRNERANFPTDIYSAALTFYMLLTGESAFTGESVVSVKKGTIGYEHIHTPLPPHSRIPTPIFAVLEKAAAKQASKRFQTAEQFKTALQNAFMQMQPADATLIMANFSITTPNLSSKGDSFSYLKNLRTTNKRLLLLPLIAVSIGLGWWFRDDITKMFKNGTNEGNSSASSSATTEETSSSPQQSQHTSPDNQPEQRNRLEAVAKHNMLIDTVQSLYTQDTFYLGTIVQRHISEKNVNREIIYSLQDSIKKWKGEMKALQERRLETRTQLSILEIAKQDSLLRLKQKFRLSYLPTIRYALAATNYDSVKALLKNVSKTNSAETRLLRHYYQRLSGDNINADTTYAGLKYERVFNDIARLQQIGIKDSLYNILHLHLLNGYKYKQNNSLNELREALKALNKYIKKSDTLKEK